MLNRSTPAAAILDVDLDGVRVDPLAEQLPKENIPLLLLTGFNENNLPACMTSSRLLHKPCKDSDVIDWLEASVRIDS